MSITDPLLFRPYEAYGLSQQALCTREETPSVGVQTITGDTITQSHTIDALQSPTHLPACLWPVGRPRRRPTWTQEGTTRSIHTEGGVGDEDCSPRGCDAIHWTTGVKGAGKRWIFPTRMITHGNYSKLENGLVSILGNLSASQKSFKKTCLYMPLWPCIVCHF